MAGRRPSCDHATEATDSEDVSAADRIPELLADREERIAQAGKSALKTALIVLVRVMAAVWTLFLVLWNSAPPQDFGQREAILRASSVVLTGALAIALASSAEDRVSIWGALAVLMVCVQVLPLFFWAFSVGA